MLAPSKPKTSRRLSSFLFGSKDKSASSDTKHKSPNHKQTNASANPPSSAPQTAAAPGPHVHETAELTHRHVSTPSIQPPSSSASQAKLTEDTTSPSSRNVSAPLLSSSKGQSPASNNDLTNITNGVGNVSISPDADIPAVERTPDIRDSNETSPNDVTSVESNQHSATRQMRAPTITMDPPDNEAPRFGELTNPGMAHQAGSRTSLVVSPPPPIPAAIENRRSSSGSNCPVVPRSSAASHGSEDRNSKTRSLIGLGTKSDKKSNVGHGLRAWIAGGAAAHPYDLTPLLSGDEINDLWVKDGDTLVYLFPQSSGRGPSFRVESALYTASPSLNYLAHGAETPFGFGSGEIDDDARSQSSRHTRDEVPDDIPQREFHLFLPVPLIGGLPSGPITNDEDIDMLVLFRNLFAFLSGQALVATPRFPDIFEIFMEVSGLLQRFEFSNSDGSTLGETVESSFKSYCSELFLWDVRHNPQKILQSMILGERLKFYPLYHEGFTHAVGKFEDVHSLKDYKLLSSLTRARLEKAAMQLSRRIEPAFLRLKDFEFPSLFSGIGNSSMSNEAGLVRFKNWKSATVAMRKHLMHYLKTVYGTWPPKPKSKTDPPLNRLVTQQLYNDMCDLYDIFVDRTSLTDRKVDMNTVLNDDDPHEATAKALRQCMSEFDRSDLPVPPAIPFDIPLLPSIDGQKHVKSKPLTKKQEAKELARRLSNGEVNEVLFSSYNTSSMKSTPWLTSFLDFERRQGHGKSINELADYRCGQWLFMYAILQSLPLLVVDAPGIGFTEGVDYFLCFHPRGGAPWVKHDPKGKAWFGVAGGGGVVSLPADTLAHSVEGIYHRSRCFINGQKWAEEQGLRNPRDELDQESPEDYEDDSQPYMHHSYNQSMDYSQQSDIASNVGGDEQGYVPYHQAYRPASLAYSTNATGAYMPLPAQQFSNSQPSQYQPYTASTDEFSTMQSPPLGKTGSSTGSIAPYGQSLQKPPMSSQQSTTSSSSNTTGSGQNGSVGGGRPPSQMPFPPAPLSVASPILPQGENGTPMSPIQYPQTQQYPYPSPLSPMSSRPQSPTMAGAPAYGVTPRLRPRQSTASRTSAPPRSSVYVGIEQLPLPQGVVPIDTAPSRVSTYNPNASFDTILKEMPSKDKKKKKINLI